MGFDRGRPRREGRLRSFIRKLQVIRGLSSGRTERDATACEAMGRESRVYLRTRKARTGARNSEESGRVWFVPSHSRNGEKRRPVLQGVRDILARLITEGLWSGEFPGYPVLTRCEARSLRHRYRGVLRPTAICATRPGESSGRGARLVKAIRYFSRHDCSTCRSPFCPRGSGLSI